MITHSATALDNTGMQRQDKEHYVVTSKLSVRMPIVLPVQQQI